jgi:hypothetical protein
MSHSWGKNLFTLKQLRSIVACDLRDREEDLREKECDNNATSERMRDENTKEVGWKKLACKP